LGCWGPVEGANPTSEFYLLKEKGFSTEYIKKVMASYSGTTITPFFEQLEKEKS
jgi:hypothetical protein